MKYIFKSLKTSVPKLYWGVLYCNYHVCKKFIGLFLLRDSQDPLHILAVTVRTDTDVIRHIRLEYTNGKY